MAGEAAPAGADRALDAISGRATATTRTTYLALLTATPTDATTMATMAEVTTPASNGYDRKAVTWTAPTDSSGVRRSENEGAVTFGAATSDWAEVTCCALVSALTGTSGDFLYWWVFDTPRNAAIGDSIQIADAALYMTLD
jgi:hypothetical protein